MKTIATLRKPIAVFLFLIATTGSTMESSPLKQEKPNLHGPSETDPNRSKRSEERLVAAIRHELVTLPYYNVFDWLEAEIRSDGQVILQGEVVRPSTSSDAEYRVRRLEGVAGVTNQIKVLSVSPLDRDLRIAVFRAIYNYNSPLFRYALRVMPPIHIVVENSRATLKGVVASESESQVAYMTARQVPGLFEVRNELRVEDRHGDE
jgi:hyperosmotically inducible periplasmic protein